MAMEAIQRGLETSEKLKLWGFKAEGKMHQPKMRGAASNFAGMYLQLRKKRKIWQLA